MLVKTPNHPLPTSQKRKEMRACSPNLLPKKLLLKNSKTLFLKDSLCSFFQPMRKLTVSLHWQNFYLFNTLVMCKPQRKNEPTTVRALGIKLDTLICKLKEITQITPIGQKG
jgi:hypothetical protein